MREHDPLRGCTNLCKDLARRVTGSPVISPETFPRVLSTAYSLSKPSPTTPIDAEYVSLQVEKDRKRFEEVCVAVGVPVLGSRFRCKLVLLRALGHDKGIHDSCGGVVGNAAAMCSLPTPHHSTAPLSSRPQFINSAQDCTGACARMPGCRGIWFWGWAVGLEGP